MRSLPNSMTDYAETLKKLEEATKFISDESLRRIAFDRLLEHELSGGKTLSKFSGQPPDSTPLAKTKQTRNKASTVGSGSKIRDEVSSLQISSDEDGLIEWHALGNLEKYLYILEAADRKQIDGLTCTEISTLIYNNFKENHQVDQVSNLKTRIRKAHVRPVKIQIGQRKLMGYQILSKGKAQLKAEAAKDVKK
jgi:hypothetical protein